MKLTPTWMLFPSVAQRTLGRSINFGRLMPCLFALTSWVASGQEAKLTIYGSEAVFPSRLFRINADNGGVGTVGSTSFVPGLDFRANGVLYGASSTLNTVSTATGAITAVGPLPELIITIAFSPSDELYGVSNNGMSLYKFDPRTGAMLNRVALTGTTFPTTSGNEFPGEIRGIDFSPDGKLYGIGFGLYLIDPNTGAATRVTPGGRGVGATLTLFADLDFGPDGQLRASTAALLEATSDLYTINPATGIGQFIGPMGVKMAGIATILETSVAPAITTQPFSLVVTAGQTASFTVTATGSPAPTYQWRKDGVNIAGAIGATLTLANIGPSAVGTYTVVVANATGSVTSNPATLDLAGGNPGRLVNLSILTALSRSGETFTVGTVLGGRGTSGTKPLLLRAIGPSLAQLGVSGVLANPTIDVFSGSVVAAANDNWGGGTALTAAFTQVGAFALAGPNSLDAAVFVPSFQPGGYTVRVSGVAGATGAVIAEIYDGTPPTEFTLATPRLVNVSVLKDLAAGETLTAGFAIGGSTSVQVLIRAVGPGLTLFSVPGAMADPAINLFDGGSRVIASNDNWGGGSALAGAFSSVGAFGLLTASRDAAVLVSLQPGTYTAQVSGVAATGGAVLVEVYELP